MICPCGSMKNYEECCGPFLCGSSKPSTPKALMRSRYTAYTQSNIDYIARTMKAPANNNFNVEEAKAWAKKLTWESLTILDSGSHLDYGFVEFIASYLENGQLQSIHEKSEFRREQGVWFYTQGKQVRDTKINTKTRSQGRNELCACGSNKKYKKCCF
ncbi:MAG: SEC-C domain-containing protein [Gammaproteobacteria bacterium]|nr:SEC-C domain-containing protein [Gammaproteobacteria bacterium]